MLHQRRSIFPLLLLVFLASNPLAAQLLCYEGFEYSVVQQTLSLRPVTNKGPDGVPLKYFEEIDTHAVRSPYQYTIQITPGSIPTKGSAFPFSPKGNALSWTREWMDAYGTIVPTFQFDTAHDNQPIYFSFALRANSGGNPVRQLAVAFSNGSSKRFQIGLDDSNNTGSPKFFACAANPQPNWDRSDKVGFKYDTTYFVVGKLETAENADDVIQMAVFAPGQQVPLNEGGVSWLAESAEWTDFLVTTVSFSIYGGSPGKVFLDELRIGSTWKSVAVSDMPLVATVENTTTAPSTEATAEVEAGSGEPTSSPVVLVIIGLGIVAFIGGGGAFFFFVIKPGMDHGPAKPLSAPKGPSAPAPKPSAPGGAPKPSPKPAAASEAPKPSFRSPKKPS
ncbi:MAG: hypothetical protein AAFX93_05655 [Verrucomicrobiota bacterium]